MNGRYSHSLYTSKHPVNFVSNLFSKVVIIAWPIASKPSDSALFSLSPSLTHSLTFSLSLFLPPSLARARSLSLNPSRMCWCVRVMRTISFVSAPTYNNVYSLPRSAVPRGGGKGGGNVLWSKSGWYSGLRTGGAGLKKRRKKKGKNRNNRKQRTDSG